MIKPECDPMWCEENPDEAVKMINDLRVENGELHDRISKLNNLTHGLTCRVNELNGFNETFENRLFKKIDSLSARMEWLCDRVLSETKLGGRKRSETRRFAQDLLVAIEDNCEEMDNGRY